MNKLKEENEKYKINYFFLSTEIEVIPKKLFYQWAIQNPHYLSTHVLRNNLTNKIDLDF